MFLEGISGFLAVLCLGVFVDVIFTLYMLKIFGKFGKSKLFPYFLSPMAFLSAAMFYIALDFKIFFEIFNLNVVYKAVCILGVSWYLSMGFLLLKKFFDFREEK